MDFRRNPPKLERISQKVSYETRTDFWAKVLRFFGIQVDDRVTITARVKDRSRFLLPNDYFRGKSGNKWVVLRQEGQILTVQSQPIFVPHPNSSEEHMAILDLDSEVIHIGNGYTAAKED